MSTARPNPNRSADTFIDIVFDESAAEFSELEGYARGGKAFEELHAMLVAPSASGQGKTEADRILDDHYLYHGAKAFFRGFIDSAAQRCYEGNAPVMRGLVEALGEITETADTDAVGLVRALLSPFALSESESQSNAALAERMANPDAVVFPTLALRLVNQLEAQLNAQIDRTRRSTLKQTAFDEGLARGYVLSLSIALLSERLAGIPQIGVALRRGVSEVLRISSIANGHANDFAAEEAAYAAIRKATRQH